jgi:hypothetical protein
MSTATIAVAGRKIEDRAGTTTIPLAPGTALMIGLVMVSRCLKMRFLAVGPDG